MSYHPSPETSDLTDHSAQTKTLDHRPPMSEAEFDTSVAPTVSYPATYRPQVDPRCQGGNSGGYTSEDDCQGVLRLVFRSIESRWEGADRWVRPARFCLRHFLTLAGLHRVFKPKDEEPYGRLNPKVCVLQSRIFGRPVEAWLGPL